MLKHFEQLTWKEYLFLIIYKVQNLLGKISVL